MIGIDTNILLRATLDDHPTQSAQARKLLATLANEHPGFVNIPVLLEFFWVLRSRYKVPRPRLAAVLRDLLGVEHFVFEALDVAGRALAAYESGKADFADSVIALRNQEFGVLTTYTFDSDAAGAIPSMELLS